MKTKKFRAETGCFLIEGDKLVSEVLAGRDIPVTELLSTPDWLQHNRFLIHEGVDTITEVSDAELRKISSFETPTGVMAVLKMPSAEYREKNLAGKLSVSLDTIQDPGNLGTIIRTADWFGITDIFCSQGCADCFNPKVVQASMGAVLRVNIHYVQLETLFEKLSQQNQYVIYGSYLEGTSIYELEHTASGMMVFGNESKGIHPTLKHLIKIPVTIPSFSSSAGHVESLNVSAAVAVFCSEFFRGKARKD
ncbi:MAG: RNA methyltransferase [Bacteroidales bacterium]|nr:RNA methyltransferase [Bacteroidales bacterium]MBN2763351.1 RNA methyltransferase [Bacteroidales bacterium]